MTLPLEYNSESISLLYSTVKIMALEATYTAKVCVNIETCSITAAERSAFTRRRGEMLTDGKAESIVQPEKIAPIPPVGCKALFDNGFDGRISRVGSILLVCYRDKIASSSVYNGQSARPVLPRRVRITFCSG